MVVSTTHLVESLDRVLVLWVEFGISGRFMRLWRPPQMHGSGHLHTVKRGVKSFREGTGSRQARGIRWIPCPSSLTRGWACPVLGAGVYRIVSAASVALNRNVPHVIRGLREANSGSLRSPRTFILGLAHALSSSCFSLLSNHISRGCCDCASFVGFVDGMGPAYCAQRLPSG